MFKTIKFVADLVRQNNNYQSALGDIILKLKKQDNTFLVSSIDEVDYIICMIDKLQKENADLKQELYIIIEKGSSFYLKSIPFRKDFQRT